MAQVWADRVKESSTTTGTGAFTLAGAIVGFRAFSAVCANADTVCYCITNREVLTEWEVGLGTWNTGGTLTRTTVYASSNAGAAVSFTAGTKDVFLTYPAKAVVAGNSLGGAQSAVLLPVDSTVDMGTGTGDAKLGGVANVNTTSQATTGTSEEVLATYTLPANALSANGKGVRITAWGTTAANGNAKVPRIRFGGIAGTQISVSTISIASQQWHHVGTIVRTGAATQVGVGISTQGTNAGSGAVSMSQSAPTQTLSGAVDIVVTGTTASGAGELTFVGMIVEFFN